ncbi:MAG: flippase-like domain-containing protein, partial [Methanomicrobiales archaeon]|nr:flippase-like domain-containing protein [Methanomicrobiales archaeon]
MWRRISALVVPTILAIGIIGYMLYQVRESLPDALKLVRPEFLVIAILVCILSWFLRGVRYQVILQGLSLSITTVYATACILVSQTANLIVPARLGDLVRIFILKDEKKATYSQGLSSLVVERVFDVVMVAILGLISVRFVFNVPGWFYTLITVPLVGGGIFFLLLYLMGMLQSDNRYIAMILTMLHEVRQVSLSARSLGFLSLSSIGIWLLDVAVCLVVIEMFQLSVPLAV